MNDIIKFEGNIEGIEEEMLSLIKDIPFENSIEQTKSVIDSALLPEKAFKVMGLRFMKRLNDLKQCGIKREQQVNKVDLIVYEIQHLKNKYQDPELIKLHEKRLQLKIDEIQAGWDYEDKLALDCKTELSYLYTTIKKLPKYTRKQFEEAEKLWLELKITSASKGLEVTSKGLAEEIEKGEIPGAKDLHYCHMRFLLN